MADRLSDLIAALAAATGPSREMDVKLAGLVFYRQPQPVLVHAMNGPWEVLTLAEGSGTDEPWGAEDIAVALEGEHTIKVPAYTSSLDAITGACEQRWPGCVWIVDNDGPEAELITAEGRGDAKAATSALALCLAAARLALAEGGR